MNPAAPPLGPTVVGRSGAPPVALAPRRATLRNGLRVVAVERRRLPLLAVRLVTYTGAARDSRGHEGLSALTVELLTRGTRRLDADALHLRLETLGGKLAPEPGTEASVLETEVPAENARGAFAILAEVAASPRFAPAEVASSRGRLADAIANDLDHPPSLAERAVRRMAYPGHPFGQPVDGRIRALRALSRGEVVDHHRRRFGPANATLLVVGDLAAEEAVALAERNFGRWASKAERPSPPMPPPPLEGVRVLVVDKPELTQVQVRIASRGIGQRSKAYFAAKVCNGAFGGSFTARLMQALRVEEGLTYGAGSSLMMRSSGGSVHLSSFTRAEAAARLVEKALAVSAAVRTRGFDEDEIRRAKAHLVGSFAFELETNHQVGLWLADLEAYGLADDFLDRYVERLEATTAAEATAFAREHLPHQDYVVAAVGPAKALAKALAAFGPVEVVRPEELA